MNFNGSQHIFKYPAIESTFEYRINVVVIVILEYFKGDHKKSGIKFELHLKLLSLIKFTF